MKLLKNLATLAIMFIFGYLIYQSSCNNNPKPKTTIETQIENIDSLEKKTPKVKTYSTPIRKFKKSSCTEHFLSEVEHFTKSKYDLPADVLAEMEFDHPILEETAEQLVNSYLSRLALRTKVDLITLDTFDQDRFYQDSSYAMNIRGKLITITN